MIESDEMIIYYTSTWVSAARIPSYISTHIVRTKTERKDNKKRAQFPQNALRNATA